MKKKVGVLILTIAMLIATAGSAYALWYGGIKTENKVIEGEVIVDSSLYADAEIEVIKHKTDFGFGSGAIEIGVQWKSDVPINDITQKLVTSLEVADEWQQYVNVWADTNHSKTITLNGDIAYIRYNVSLTEMDRASYQALKNKPLTYKVTVTMEDVDF